MDQATKTLVEHMMPTEMIIKEPSEAAMKHVIAHARRPATCAVSAAPT